MFSPCKLFDILVMMGSPFCVKIYQIDCLLFFFQLVLPAGGRLVRTEGQEIWGRQWKGNLLIIVMNKTCHFDNYDDQ